MELIDWIVLIGAVAVVAGSIVAWLRRKKKGVNGCGCSCSSCSLGANCPSKQKEKQENQ